VADNRRRSGAGAGPDERYREFAEENADWDRKVEETLTELDEPKPEEPTPSKSEPTPA
jgi:hypothetical protein